MKHNIKVIGLVLILFFMAQIIGLIIINAYSGEEKLPLGMEKVELKEGTSFFPVFITILLVTGLALLLIKAQIKWLWILWFFISISFALTIAFGAWLNIYMAAVLALIFTYVKIFRKNIYVHNFTELFIYGGLIAIFAGSFNVFSAVVLLMLISIYDMIAVWKTKHMIDLARFQNKVKVFAGLLIPYGKKMAVLGGGDMAFTLLFAAVAVKALSLYSLIIPVFSTLSLFALFYFGEKKKFYPAMPFLTVGCLTGYGVLRLVQFLI